MDCSRAGLPLSQTISWGLPKFMWCISDAFQLSHPLSPSSPSAFNLSQHQGLFQWVGSSFQVAKLLDLQLQHQSFQWIFRVDFFKIDWFDLLVVERTLKSLLQHNSLKASILWQSYPNTNKKFKRKTKNSKSSILGMHNRNFFTLLLTWISRSRTSK